jgi:hypothetical protein
VIWWEDDEAPAPAAPARHPHSTPRVDARSSTMRDHHAPLTPALAWARDELITRTTRSTRPHYMCGWTQREDDMLEELWDQRYLTRSSLDPCVYYPTARLCARIDIDAIDAALICGQRERDAYTRSLGLASWPGGRGTLDGAGEKDLEEC